MGVWLSVPTQVSGKATPIAHLHHRRHLLQVDLVHDAVARRNHVHVLERGLGPVDEVEAVLVTALLHRPVLLEGILLETGMFHRQGMVDDQLGRHHRIHLGRITALGRNRIPQPRQIHQRGLAEDVMAHHPRREPGKVQVPLALDDLLEGVGQLARLTAAHQVLGQHAGGVGQLVVSARLNVLDRGAGVEIVQVGAWQGFAVLLVHGGPFWKVLVGGGRGIQALTPSPSPQGERGANVVSGR